MDSSSSGHTLKQQNADSSILTADFTRLLRDYPEAVSDRRRFIALLKDFFPRQKKQANLLSMLYNFHIADEIEATESLDQIFMRRFEKRLADEYATNKDDTEWAVAVWCECYGKELLGKPFGMAAPSPNPPANSTQLHKKKPSKPPTQSHKRKSSKVKNTNNLQTTNTNVVDDLKLDEAIKVIMDTGIASASGLHRYLNVGYPRAGRIITALEQIGIIGPPPIDRSKSREILMDEEDAFDALERARNEKEMMEEELEEEEDDGRELAEAQAETITELSTTKPDEEISEKEIQAPSEILDELLSSLDAEADGGRELAESQVETITELSTTKPDEEKSEKEIQIAKEIFDGFLSALKEEKLKDFLLSLETETRKTLLLTFETEILEKLLLSLELETRKKSLLSLEEAFLSDATPSKVDNNTDNPQPMNPQALTPPAAIATPSSNPPSTPTQPQGTSSKVNNTNNSQTMNTNPRVLMILLISIIWAVKCFMDGEGLVWAVSGGFSLFVAIVFFLGQFIDFIQSPIQSFHFFLGLILECLCFRYGFWYGVGGVICGAVVCYIIGEIKKH